MRHVLMPQAVRNALPALVNHSVSLFKNSSLAMAIGVAELTHAVKEVENQSFRTFETYLIATVVYLACSLLIMAVGAWLGQRATSAGAQLSRCWPTSIEILRDNWLLLLIGQYPNGPLGGIAATLILSVLGIVAGVSAERAAGAGALSPWRAAALAGDGAGLHRARRAAADDHILWVYFLVPLLIGRNVSGFVTMLCHAGGLRGRVPERGRARRHPGAARADRWRPPARSATATSARCDT